MIDIIGNTERATQNRIVSHFRDELGYDYHGNWEYRDGNSNIEEGLLSDYLKRNGYSEDQSTGPFMHFGPKPTTTVAASMRTY